MIKLPVRGAPNETTDTYFDPDDIVRVEPIFVRSGGGVGPVEWRCQITCRVDGAKYPIALLSEKVEEMVRKGREAKK